MARAAEAKGELVEAKPSKPERLAGVAGLLEDWSKGEKDSPPKDVDRAGLADGVEGPGEGD